MGVGATVGAETVSQDQFSVPYPNQVVLESRPVPRKPPTQTPTAAQPRDDGIELAENAPCVLSCPCPWARQQKAREPLDGDRYCDYTRAFICVSTFRRSIQRSRNYGGHQERTGPGGSI